MAAAQRAAPASSTAAKVGRDLIVGSSSSEATASGGATIGGREPRVSPKPRQIVRGLADSRNRPAPGAGSGAAAAQAQRDGGQAGAGQPRGGRLGHRRRAAPVDAGEL